ncbi:MAG TPA: LysM peptidoglycan-binding domain-containing protein, partial [Thermoanaerobaculia bacterium]|nr:LysM peptidoglycan-binding domain-containing protein [Thermoanaerobaculia bacterium]
MNARFSGVSKVTLLATAVAVIGMASPTWGASHPPKGLHYTGDHWTAWNPPAPPAGAQIHTVAKGDTLWELAKKYYGNPYLWPQLWEKNQYVQDAHWIYPGDPLVLGPQVTPGENLAQGGGATTVPATELPGEKTAATAANPEKPGAEKAPPPDIKGVLSAGAAAGSPIPLGVESDIDCGGYIGDSDESFPYAILGSEFDVLSPKLDSHSGGVLQGAYGPIGAVKYGLSTGDIIYLNGGRGRGLKAGSTFTIINPEQEVKHPKTGAVVGRFYRYLGRVRVLSVQEDSAIAEIVFSCDPIVVGSLLQPYQPEPVPLARPTAMRPVNYPVEAEKLAGAATIVLSRDNLVSLGEDHIVWIDRGANADVTP